jgi:hypothetical protein
VSHLFYFQTCEELQEGWVQLRQQVGANLYRVRLIG